MTKKINNLAVVIRIAIGFDMLFQLKNLNLITPFHVNTGHNPSMQGVGIVLGIVAQVDLRSIADPPQIDPP